MPGSLVYHFMVCQAFVLKKYMQQPSHVFV